MLTIACNDRHAYRLEPWHLTQSSWHERPCFTLHQDWAVDHERKGRCWPYCAKLETDPSSTSVTTYETILRHNPDHNRSIKSQEESEGQRIILTKRGRVPLVFLMEFKILIVSSLFLFDVSNWMISRSCSCSLYVVYLDMKTFMYCTVHSFLITKFVFVVVMQINLFFW
jgi:hypothetical protein